MRDKLAIGLLLCTLLNGAGAQPTAYPNKPVKIMVGYAAGGGTDVIARIVGQALSTRWNQSVVIENKPGASGMLAGEAVARAAPDGYVLLLGYTPEVSINKLVFKQMSYEPTEELLPVALVASAPLYLVVGPKLSVQTAKELLARDKKAEPLSYGSPGTGGQQHLAGELFQIRTGVKTLHIPYKGAAPAVNDLLGGQLDMFFSTPPVILSHVRSGKLRPLFVTSSKRDAALPEVPSASEVGLVDFEIANWFGVFAPRGTDPALITKLSSDVEAVLADKAVAKKLEDQGLTVTFKNSSDLKQYIGTEMKKYGAIIDQAGLAKQ